MALLEPPLTGLQTKKGRTCHGRANAILEALTDRLADRLSRIAPFCLDARRGASGSGARQVFHHAGGHSGLCVLPSQWTLRFTQLLPLGTAYIHTLRGSPIPTRALLRLIRVDPDQKTLNESTKVPTESYVSEHVTLHTPLQTLRLAVFIFNS